MAIKKEYSFLNIYQEYSRRDLHDIFDPELSFSNGAGKWGGSGIVNIVDDDFAFLVTLDENSNNNYADALTEDGVLIWKSQNRQHQNTTQIKKFKSHNHEQDNILLFLRANESQQYTFFGPLSLKDWDPNSNNPVHFTWEVLSWPVPHQVLSKRSITLLPSLNPNYSEPASRIVKTSLKLNKPPSAGFKPRGRGTYKRSFNNVSWEEKESRNRALGNAGEELVIEFERQKLISAGRNDLAERIEYTAQIQSNAGYDITSYDSKTGEEKFIEVKTTTGNSKTPFFISSNEVQVSEELKEKYWIYRIYDFSFDSSKAEIGFFSINGPVSDKFDLIANSYMARVK